MSGHVFDKKIVRYTAHRCAWGNPQTIVCTPISGDKIFPTLFWLTCPFLSRICGVIESNGGVRDLEQFLYSRFKGYREYNSTYALIRLSLLNKTELRFLRIYKRKYFDLLRLTGIGGIRLSNMLTVKCIHLQLATYLSLKGHPGSQWFSRNFTSFSCHDPSLCRCIYPLQ